MSSLRMRRAELRRRRCFAASMIGVGICSTLCGLVLLVVSERDVVLIALGSVLFLAGMAYVKYGWQLR